MAKSNPRSEYANSPPVDACSRDSMGLAAALSVTAVPADLDESR